MKNVLVIHLIFVLATPLFAGSSHCYVIAVADDKEAAVSLEKEADYVSMSLTLESDQKEPGRQFTEIKQLQGLIMTKANEILGIEIHKGPISLSAGASKSKLSRYSYYRPSTAQLHVLAKLDEQTDIYDAATRIINFLMSVKNLHKDNYALGEIQLVVKNPQDYRQAILEKIYKDIAFVKSVMKPDGTITLSGLDNPVMVRQLDDRKVELFIHHSMTVEFE